MKKRKFQIEEIEEKEVEPEVEQEFFVEDETDNEEFISFIKEYPGNVGFMFIGRTTPPTSGHLGSFLKMINLRKEIGRDIPIILNLSPSSPENLKKIDDVEKFEDPLTCDQKIHYIRSMLIKLSERDEPGVFENIFPICLSKTPLAYFRGNQLKAVVEENRFNLNLIVVFVGQDRFDTSKTSVAKLMQNYKVISSAFRESGAIPEIKVFVLQRDKRRDPTSGTKIRETILKNSSQSEAINALRPLYTFDGIQLLDNRELGDLYRDVTNGMLTGRSELRKILEKREEEKESKKTKSKKPRTKKGEGRKRTRHRKRLW
jgi:hypothetical protein